LRREGKRLIKSMGECAKKYWEFRDLLQMGWLNWSWVETVGGGKVMSTLVKYWQRILQMDKDDLVRVCCDWQITNAQYDGWAKKLEKELNKIGLVHILRNPTVCKEVKGRCNDIKKLIFSANLSGKRSLIFYRDMKLWDREYYVMCGSRNDRSGIAWFRTGIWKLRGVRKG
jgi:hypothetical protein